MPPASTGSGDGSGAAVTTTYDPVESQPNHPKTPVRRGHRDDVRPSRAPLNHPKLRRGPVVTEPQPPKTKKGKAKTKGNRKKGPKKKQG